MSVNSFIRELSRGLNTLETDKSILFFITNKKNEDIRILQLNHIKKDFGSNGRKSVAIKTKIISV